MSYSGNKAKIPLGEYGLLTDIAPDKMPPQALIHARNISFVNGCVEKAPGTIHWNAVALPGPIVAIHEWLPTLDKKRMIAVLKTGSIYVGRDRQFKTPGNTGIGLLTPNCIFTEGGMELPRRDKKLFLFTAGVSNPYVLTGDQAVFRLLTGPSPDWIDQYYPKFGIVHRSRLWAFVGSRAYASDSGDHENFTTNSLTSDVYPGEGGEFRGGFVYKGKLFAFKDGGFVYLLNDTDPDTENWYWEKIASNFGLSAPNAVAEVLDNLYSGNTTGTITDFAATQKLGSVEAGDLIQNCQFENYLRGSTSKVGVTEQHLLYYAEKKLLFATYRSGYYTQNDMLLVFDFGRTQVTRPSFWLKGSPQCLATYRDMNEIERPMYGDAAGFVHLMDREDRTEGGTSYSGMFQTAHLDFSHLDPSMSSTEKFFDHLAVHYLPESTGTLLCDYFIDGRFIETISFPMLANPDAKLNTLTLNQDRLAQRNEETCIRRLSGSGRTFSAKFYNAGNNQSFRIPAITVFFRGGGEKATQQKGRS